MFNISGNSVSADCATYPNPKYKTEHCPAKEGRDETDKFGQLTYHERAKRRYRSYGQGIEAHNAGAHMIFYGALNKRLVAD